jgi:hypothetical protein
MNFSQRTRELGHLAGVGIERPGFALAGTAEAAIPHGSGTWLVRAMYEM